MQRRLYILLLHHRNADYTKQRKLYASVLSQKRRLYYADKVISSALP